MVCRKDDGAVSECTDIQVRTRAAREWGSNLLIVEPVDL